MDSSSLQTLFLRIYLFDASLHEDTLKILRSEVQRGWYAGESNPSFIQKIPELRDHPLTTDAHREVLHKLLPSYGKIDESVFLEDEHDEDFDGQEAKPSRALSQLFPQGELSLAFAGPCAQLEITGKLESDQDMEQFLRELAMILTALKSTREYFVVDSRNVLRRLTWDDVPGLVKTEFNRIKEIATKAADDKKRVAVVFWGLNTLFALALLWLFVYGIQHLGKIQAIDLANQFTFVVQQKTNLNHRVVIPDFRVSGVIRETNEPAMLKLFRDEFVSVQPGYELSALKTNDPSEPYVLAWYVEKHSPFTIGPIKINIELIVWAAFAVGWGTLLYRYQTAKSDYQRDSIARSTTSAVIGLGGVLALVISVIWLRGIFN